VLCLCCRCQFSFRHSHSPEHFSQFARAENGTDRHFLSTLAILCAFRSRLPYAVVRRLSHLVPSSLAVTTALPSLLTVRAMSAASSSAAGAGDASNLPPFPQTDAEWRQKLSGAEYAVLRQKDTERPGEGGYTKTTDEGVYVCKGCDAPLYDSKTKFHSGCGWPAFWDGLPGAIKRVPDADGRRVEILCARCDSHLGHVFTGEGFGNPVDDRHCVNSCSLKLNKKK
jgi:peptide-methionine (R)-S-oxide reductase